MYASYFGLKQEPFSIAPDPRLLFMSERHREALAHLLYGVGGTGGFVLLTGEIGTGKTTVCQLFLEQVPDQCNVAYIFNPKLTSTELLQSVCEEFHIATPQSGHALTVKDHLDPLNAFLLREHASGRNSVLVIDEAQNLSADVLEQLRLLTNLETRERKLLQIVLIGQPELRAMLARPELEQLAQRVIARYHLDALSEAETLLYVQHRLEAAGLTRPLPFDRRALQRVFRITRGVPRRINLLCDRALLGAFAGGQATVDRATVEKAAAEVFDRSARPGLAGWTRPATVLAAIVVAAAALWSGASRTVAPRTAGDALAVRGRAPSVEVAKAVPAPAAGALASRGEPALFADESQAWRELAKAWNVALGHGAPCQALQRVQVHCFRREMSLPLIRQLGRPGIVTLDAGTGKPSYALLTALTPDSATLRAGESEQTVTLLALAARWNGEFATLWRAPPGYSGRLAERDSGTTVHWIAATLARASGVTGLPAGQSLDRALREKVQAFQLAQGLPADGRPGPLTFMQLNRAAAVDEPRLHTTR
ncbi:MAG: ExeA family protein [Ramlibacter sp.]